jgi:hypothetical protein
MKSPVLEPILASEMVNTLEIKGFTAVRGKMVLPERIELSTSPLPRECSTTELRQRRVWGRLAFDAGGIAAFGSGCKPVRLDPVPSLR